MKILFFGDSITEGGRNAFDPTDLGSGYVKIAANKLRLLYPDTQFEILNRGVGGNTTSDLLLRTHELEEEKPDIIVLQIGINDVWQRFSLGVDTPPETFKKNYIELVKRGKETGAKLILIQPYVLSMEDKRRFRPYLDRYNKAIREVAAKEKLPLIPMDEIFTGLTQDIAPSQFTTDGVHPTHRGCRYLADQVIKELKKYL